MEEIRVELTKGPPLSYEEVEDTLDALKIRGYVEEFEPGRWQASNKAHHIRRRLLGASPATV